MATITSSTHGPFDLGSTWVGGVAPVNADSFIINYGHVVSVTGDQRPVGGFDDSFVRGKLHMFSGSRLRMSGILYVDNTAANTAYFSSGNSATAGFFRMDNGSILELRGSNADQHRLEVRAQNFVTCEIEGNTKNPTTIVSGNYDINSVKFAVSGLSGIAVGDWINIYRSTTPSGSFTGGAYLNNRSDEGVWIHDISGTDIYFRKFVSPTGVIVSTFSSGVVVNDSYVFRNGYDVVFGTGADLNVQRISNIDYGSNSISFNAAVTGSVVGKVIYRTAFDKAHKNGDTVQKIASTLIATSNAGSNTITVNSTQGFSTGDLILIPANDETSTATWDYIQDFRIASIAGNTITITGGYTSSGQNTLPTIARSGGIVANMTRETQIITPSGSTAQASFFYVAPYSTNYSRRVKITNTLFNIGSNTNSSAFGCVSIGGYQAYDEQSAIVGNVGAGAYTSLFEGNVVYPATRQAQSLIALSINRNFLNFRNNISYNGEGYGIYTYGTNYTISNSIFARIANYGIIVDSVVDSSCEIAYNYIIRIASYGMAIRQTTDASSRIAHNYILYIRAFPFEFYYTNPGTMISDCYIDGFIIWPLVRSRNGQILIKNSYFGNRWDITTPVGTGLVYNNGIDLRNDYQEARRSDGFGGLMMSVNHNFRMDSFVTWNQGVLRKYDSYEQSWRVYPSLNFSATAVVYPGIVPTAYIPALAGFMNTIYVPAGAKVFITAQVKTSSQFSANTNYPYLMARTSHDYYWGQYKTLTTTSEQPPSSSTTSEAAGFMTRQRFTSASANNYETITLTIDAQRFDYFLAYGVICENPSLLNGRNGWYEKNVIASIDKPSQSPDLLTLNHLTSQVPVTIRQTANQLKTILGG